MSLLTKSNTVRILAMLIRETTDLLYYCTLLKSKSLKYDTKMITKLNGIVSCAIRLRDSIMGRSFK